MDDNDKNPSDDCHPPPATQSDTELPHLFKEFNAFLQITDADIDIVRRYRQLLSTGATQFARVFYDFLFAFPATAEVLKRHEDQNGDIERLVESQLQHLLDLLRADTGTEASQRLIHIGQIHFQRSIEPIWLMGAYRLYLEHLQLLLDPCTGGIPRNDCDRLSRALPKLLFRDIGLMLEGYWNAAIDALRTEKKKVDGLQQQVSSLLANVPQVLWSVDVINNRPLYISPATQDMCALDAEMPIPCLTWTVPQDQEKVRAAWTSALAGERAETESRVIAPGKEPRWFRRIFHPYTDESGRVVRIDGVMEDTTQAKHTLQRLERLATTDTLTGLANRALWYDRLTRAIASARRTGNQQVVLMLLDLNHFKIINDTLGHPAGDILLREVAQRLKTVLRDSDTLARLGGDEFSVILPATDDPRQASKKVARKILACFQDPFRLHENNEIYLGASIGIVFYPDHGADADSLVSRADIAMYSAKRGDSDYFFYDPGSDAAAAEQLQLSGGLRRAVECNEFQLHFQPKVEIASKRICGVEALLRWDHADRGMVSPAEFIPVAEQNGTITPITDWVLGRALETCKSWQQAGFALPVAVNVSARSFQNPKFIDMIKRAIARAGVSGDCLEVEITEHIMMADIEHGTETLTRLSALGVRIAIDDFGTGYSSLSYLKRRPIDTIKIDKSFILDMTDNENHAVIVRSIIDLGHNLGLKVVAEGVEDLETWNLLEILRCDSVQGYYVSRPVTSMQFDDWLNCSQNPWQADHF